MILANAALVAGLALVSRVVYDLSGRLVAVWTMLALVLGTFLLPSFVARPGALARGTSFALAALALALWRRTGGPGATPRDVGATLALLGAIAIPFAAAGARPRFEPEWIGATLFSAPQGLLFVSPILWAGFAGLGILWRREGRRTVALVAALAVALLASTGRQAPDPLFAGGRLHAVLPPLALGLGAFLAWLRDAVARRPWAPLAAAGMLLTVWNFLLMEQYRSDRIPRDLPVSFPKVTETNLEILDRAFGSPPTWPASWVFAWRYRTTPAKYDVVAGRSLLEEGRAFSFEDPKVDPALLADGWGGRTACAGTPCRPVASSARIFLPLGRKAPCALTVEASGLGVLSVQVNGAPAGEIPLSPSLEPHRLPAAAPWRPGVNEVRLSVTGTGDARVSGFGLVGEGDEP